MKTLRRYLVREIMAATALVFVALLMLFAFFDLVDQIGDWGRGATACAISWYLCCFRCRTCLELFPIAVLIGTLFALAQLVASSEYTVMRTSGVSLTRMSVIAGGRGLMFAATAFVFGEFVAPPAEQFAQRCGHKAVTGLVAQEFRSGLWVKDEKVLSMSWK